MEDGKMSNEPVAWLVQYKDRHEFRWNKPEHLFEALACEPLYTHPAKTLTDEEIQQIWLEFDARNTNDWFIAIARAILRKAQEK
jgi:hypothetical protein